MSRAILHAIASDRAGTHHAGAELCRGRTGPWPTQEFGKKKELCVSLAQSTETMHAHTQHLVSSQASTWFPSSPSSLSVSRSCSRRRPPWSNQSTPPPGPPVSLSNGHGDARRRYDLASPCPAPSHSGATHHPTTTSDQCVVRAAGHQFLPLFSSNSKSTRLAHDLREPP